MRYIIVLSLAIILGACASNRPTTKIGELELLGQCTGNLDTYVKVMLPQKSKMPRQERRKIGWAKRSLGNIKEGKNLIEDKMLRDNPKAIIPKTFDRGFKVGQAKMVKMMAADNSLIYQVEMYYLIKSCLEISNEYALDVIDLD